MFHAGAPVWGIDWCPIHPEDRPRESFEAVHNSRPSSLITDRISQIARTSNI